MIDKSTRRVVIQQMASITKGSSGTLKSGTLEGQAVEIMTFLQTQEKDKNKNTSGSSYVKTSFNASGLTFTGTFDIPIDQVTDSNGLITLSAKNYLQNTGFNAGTNGTFMSNNPAQYLLEVIIALQNKEKDTAKNPQQLNNISVSYSGDDGTFSGTVNVPLQMSIDNNGNTIFTAVEYLS